MLELENICIGIVYSSEKPSFIEIDNTSTVLEAILMAGYEEVKGYDLYAFHRGKCLNLFVSLLGNGVKDNGKIYIGLKRRKDGSRARAFLESLKYGVENSKNRAYSEAINRKRTKIINERRFQMLRAIDLSYLSFETVKTYPRILSDMVKNQEARVASMNNQNETSFETNLNFMSKISEEPLPILVNFHEKYNC